MNAYNNNGKPDGYWISLYDNGDLYFTGIYNNGLRFGYWHINIISSFPVGKEYKIYYL